MADDRADDNGGYHRLPARLPVRAAPVPEPGPAAAGRGELSAAFCQAQHDVASRDGWEINL